MSISTALYTGVSGLLNNGESMNVIGNNLANVNTVGFKGARSLFSDMLSASVGNNSQIGRGMQMQQVQNLFSQSGFQNSENVTDLAIQGSSFFSLGQPNGNATVSAINAYYTRAGAFHVDRDGYLVNPDGYQVLDNARTPIKFDPANFTKITKIDTDGTITYLDAALATQTYATPIGLANIRDTSKMAKAGGTLYTADSSTGIADTDIKAPDGVQEKLLSNSLEMSNVDMASEFVRMITTQRAYSANSKTITTTDEMMQEVLQLKR